MQPDEFVFADGGEVPNSKLPLLVYRQAVPADPDAIERTFAGNGWSGGWRNSIFPYHHFHSTSHEVLGIASGTATVRFGGPSGQSLQVQAGDVVVIPAGVGHCREAKSDDLLVVGAYPGGNDYDLHRAGDADPAEVRQNIARVPTPPEDPVAGPDGPLPRRWGGQG